MYFSLFIPKLLYHGKNVYQQIFIISIKNITKSKMYWIHFCFFYSKAGLKLLLAPQSALIYDIIFTDHYHIHFLKLRFLHYFTSANVSRRLQALFVCGGITNTLTFDPSFISSASFPLSPYSLRIEVTPRYPRYLHFYLPLHNHRSHRYPL